MYCLSAGALDSSIVIWFKKSPKTRAFFCFYWVQNTLPLMLVLTPTKLPAKGNIAGTVMYLGLFYKDL